MAMSDRVLPLAHHPERATTETATAKVILIAIAVLFLAAILFLPLVTVFIEALRKGWGTLFESFSDPDTLAAIRLTLLVAAIAGAGALRRSLARRRAAWKPKETIYPRGYGQMFAKHVTQADKGCDFDFLEGNATIPEPEIH